PASPIEQIQRGGRRQLRVQRRANDWARTVNSNAQITRGGRTADIGYGQILHWGSIVINNGEAILRTVHSRRDVDPRCRRNRIDHVPHRHSLRQIDGGRIPGAVCNGDTPWLYPLALPQTGERRGAVERRLEVGDQEL